MYERFKQFFKDPDNETLVIESIRKEEKQHNITLYSKDEIYRQMVIAFVNENVDEQTFLVDDGIFNDFPLSEQLKILQPWSNDAYYWCWDATMYEVMKLAMKLAPEYFEMNWHTPPRTFPHTELFRIFYAMKSDIVSLLDLKTREEFFEARKSPSKKNLLCKYWYFTHLCLLPLFKDNALEILEHVSLTLPYGDSEEGICFAIAQLDIKDPEVLQVVQRIFVGWESHDHSISFYDVGGKLELIINVWMQKHNFIALQDPILGPIVRRNTR